MENLRVADLEVRRLPGFYRLTLQLSTQLDHEHPLGNDYRMVLEYLGFHQGEISFFASKVTRPTVDALKCWRGTTGQLVQALRRSERDDAVNDMRRWLGDLIGYTDTDLPPIEKLLQEEFSEPPETQRQISDLFMNRNGEASTSQTPENSLFEKITECVKNSFYCECEASLWQCWITGSCKNKYHTN